VSAATPPTRTRLARDESPLISSTADFATPRLSGKKFDQAGIGLAIDGRRGEPYLQRLAVQPGNFGLLRSGLDVQAQDDAVAVGQEPAHSIAGNTL
jgi:hypothetical protein